MQPSFRPATRADLSGILEIYNHYVAHSTATFDLEARSAEAGKIWLESRSDRHPVLVATIGDSVVGWASLSPWSHHGGYKNTVELSIYIQPEMTGKGIGSRLLSRILQAGKDLGHRCIMARISVENDRSRALHQRNGFEIIGVMRQAGEKHGRLLDVTLLHYLT